MFNRFKKKKIELSIEEAEAILDARREQVITNIVLIGKLKNLNHKFKGLIEIRSNVTTNCVPYWTVGVTDKGLKLLNETARKYPFYFAEKGVKQWP